MLATAYHEVLQKFYIAYFGRPADPTGLLAAQALADSGAPTTTQALLDAFDTNATVRGLINGFGNSEESRALFAGTSTVERVTAIYQNVLDRDPDAGGLAYWAGEIDSGRLSLAKVSLAILAAAEKDIGGDALTVANRVTVATYFTTELNTTDETNAYVGNEAAAFVRAGLAAVNASTDTTAFRPVVDQLIYDLTYPPVAATISNPSNSSVTEDVAVNASGNLTASGTLAITDPNPGQAAFQTSVISTAGNLGSLSLATNGNYTYTVANSATQDLGAGQTKVDTFTVTAADGTTKAIEFTINGASDAAVIGNPSTASVTEDVAVNPSGNLTASGTIAINDPTPGQNSFQTSVTGAAGNLGGLELATDGRYTYSVANSLTQYLGEGQIKTDTFTITSLDGTTKNVQFSIRGTNDAAVIGTPTVASVTEDLNPDMDGNLTARGTLSISDLDQNQASFSTSVTSAEGNLGQLSLATNGSYTYTVLNSATQYLSAGQTKVDRFTVTAADGTTKDIQFTINGVNDVSGVPVLSQPGAIALTDTAGDDAFMAATGTLSATDNDLLTYGITDGTDNGDTVTRVGTYGTLTVTKATGAYTYTPVDAAIEGLKANATDTFTVTASDGALSDSKTLTVNLTGVNDTPVAVADEFGTTEDTAITFTAAQLLGNDSDRDDAAAQLGIGTVTSGTGGTAVRNSDGTVTFTPNANFNGLASFSYTATDGSLNSAPATVTVYVGAVNEEPIANPDTNTGATLDVVTESGVEPEGIAFPGDPSASGNVLTNDTAVDTGDGVTVSAVNNLEENVGTLVAGTYGSVSISANGSYAYTLDNTKAATQALAQGEEVNEVFSYTVQDSGALTSSSTLTISIRGTNDAPTAIALDNFDIDENAAGGTLVGLLSATDVDTGDSFTYALLDDAGGRFQLVGNQLQATGTGLDFETNDEHGIEVRVTDSGNATFTQTFRILVNDVPENIEAPIVDITSGALTYTENDPATNIDSGLTVSDVDSLTLASATVQITSEYVSGQDFLRFANTATISGSFNTANGTLTLTGIASVSDYEAALRSVTYENTSDDPGTRDRRVTFTVDDGLNSSDPARRNIDINRVNDAPVATIVLDNYSATEQTLLTLKDTGLSVSDVDESLLGALSVTLAVTEGTLTATEGNSGITNLTGSGTGILNFSGTVTQINNFLGNVSTGTLSYINNSDNPPSATLMLSVNDNGNGGGGALSDDDSATISLAAVNDAANITGTNSGSITEDATPNTVSNTLTVMDVDTGEAVFAALTTEQKTGTYGSFDITAQGVWTYTLDNSKAATQNLNTGDTATDTFTVRSLDGTAMQSVTITINGANENVAPVVSNVMLGTPLTYTAVDADPLTLRIRDNANNNFTVQAATDTPPNFAYTPSSQTVVALAGVLEVVDPSGLTAPIANVYVGTGNGNTFSALNNPAFIAALPAALYGFGGSDNLIGSDLNDYIDGGADNDSLVGGLGDDTFFGTQANDTIDGGEGEDLVVVSASATSYVPANDARLSGVETVALVAGNSNGVIILSIQSEGFTVLGNAGNNILIGGIGNDVIRGNEGDDELVINNGRDSLYGGSGNDVFVFNNTDSLADYNNSQIDGGEGTDTLSLLANSITYRPSDDNLTGVELVTLANRSSIELDFSLQTEALTVSGNQFADVLIGGMAADSIAGGDGEDTIDAGPGQDTVDGGGGIDTFSLGQNDNAIDTVLDNGSAVAIASSSITGFDLVTQFTVGQDVLNFDNNNTTGRQLTGTFDSTSRSFTLGNAANSNDVLVFTDNNGNNQLDATENAIVLTGLAAGGMPVDLNGGGAGNGNGYAAGVIPVNPAINDKLAVSDNLNSQAGPDPDLQGARFSATTLLANDLGSGLSIVSVGDATGAVTGVSLSNGIITVQSAQDFMGGPANLTTGSFTYTLNTGDTATVSVDVIKRNAFSENSVDASMGYQSSYLAGSIFTADTLIGGDGVDTFVVNSSAVNSGSINGGAGAEDTLIVYGSSNAIFDFSAVTNVEFVRVANGSVVTSLNGATFTQLDALSTGALMLLSVTTDRSFILNGGSASDRVFFTTGTTSTQTVNGGAGDDIIQGGSANDALSGGEGNDALAGGTGADLLTGGEGNDVFFIPLGDSPVTDGAAGSDTITDFSSGDAVNLGGPVGTATNYAESAIVYDDINQIASAADTAFNGTQRYFFAQVNLNGTNTGALAYDANGDGSFNSGDAFVFLAGTNDAGFGFADIVGTPVNAAPMADDDTYSTIENTTLSIAAQVGVLNGDTDTEYDVLFVIGNTNPVHGTVTVNADGSFIYSPEASYVGMDSFDYTVSDGISTDTGTVTITINAGNTPPVVSNVVLGSPSITYTAVDADPLTLRIRNNANSDFTVQAATGIAPNFTYNASAQPTAALAGVLEVVDPSGLTSPIANVYVGTGDINTFSALNNPAFNASLPAALYGFGGNDNLTGGNQNDFIDGGSGNDSLDGGEGNDTLFGVTDNDTANGGNGDDVAVVLGGTTYQPGDANLVNVETIRTLSAAGLPETIVVLLQSENITLVGGAGVDFIGVASSSHLIDGGDGLDLLSVGLTQEFNPTDANLVNVETVVSGGSGDNGGGDILINLGQQSEAFDVSIFTSTDPINATVIGGAGDDTLIGGSGSDLLEGGLGNDTLVGDSGMLGGKGGSDFKDVLRGGEGNDSLNGVDGDDSLYGGAGNDTLTGGEESDLLEGGTGADVINLGGESGFTTDLVVIRAGDSPFSTNLTGIDTVNGFTETDQVDFDGPAGTATNFGGSVNPVANGAAAIAAANTAFAANSQLRYYAAAQTADSGWVFFDRNGDHALNADDEAVRFSSSRISFESIVGTPPPPPPPPNATPTFVAGSLNATADGIVTLRVNDGNLGQTLRSDSPGGDDIVPTVTPISPTVNSDSLIAYVADSVNTLRNSIVSISDGTASTGLLGMIVEFSDADGGVSLDNNASVTTFFVFYGNGGNDTLGGGVADDFLFGGIGNDLLSGAAGNDVLHGGEGNDTVFGGVGSDTLEGGVGSDTLEGGAGVDMLDLGGGDVAGTANGGGGVGYSDRVVISEGDSSFTVMNSLAGADTVAGFVGRFDYFITVVSINLPPTATVGSMIARDTLDFDGVAASASNLADGGDLLTTAAAFAAANTAFANNTSLLYYTATTSSEANAPRLVFFDGNGDHALGVGDEVVVLVGSVSNFTSLNIV